MLEIELSIGSDNCPETAAKRKHESHVIGFRTIPYFTHFWGEVEGRRFEIPRPLGSAGSLGIIP